MKRANTPQKRIQDPVGIPVAKETNIVEMFTRLTLLEKAGMLKELRNIFHQSAAEMEKTLKASHDIINS